MKLMTLFDLVEAMATTKIAMAHYRDALAMFEEGEYQDAIEYAHAAISESNPRVAKVLSGLKIKY